MGNGTSKANPAKANEKRDYRIYESFALILVAGVQKFAIPEISSVSFKLKDFQLII